MSLLALESLANTGSSWSKEFETGKEMECCPAFHMISMIIIVVLFAGGSEWP
jgi:hypothetical protein